MQSGPAIDNRANGALIVPNDFGGLLVADAVAWFAERRAAHGIKIAIRMARSAHCLKCFIQEGRERIIFGLVVGFKARKRMTAFCDLSAEQIARLD